MKGPIDDSFVQHINQNLGIAYKVAGSYSQDDDDRDDLIQEMMYQLWRSYSSFDGRSKFSTWMYSVCLNTALTYKRKQKKEKIESLAPSHYQIAETPSEDKEEAINLLFEVIATLSPLNKAITLLYLESMSYEEIASITGLTKSNVSVRLIRIKKELEEKMKLKFNTTEK